MSNSQIEESKGDQRPRQRVEFDEGLADFSEDIDEQVSEQIGDPRNLITNQNYNVFLNRSGIAMVDQEIQTELEPSHQNQIRDQSGNQF